MEFQALGTWSRFGRVRTGQSERMAGFRGGSGLDDLCNSLSGSCQLLLVSVGLQAGLPSLALGIFSRCCLALDTGKVYSNLKVTLRFPFPRSYLKARY